MADDNKPLKYARYAIGEIALVMIGILLALQVNNWNEKRKNNNLKNTYIANLIIDLNEDIKSLERLNKYNTSYENSGFYTLNFMDNKLTQIDTLALTESIIYCAWIPNFTVNATTYNDVINGNNINLFKDTKLKRLLENYYTRDEWNALFNDRILKTAWYDYRDELVKFISPLLYRDTYELRDGFKDKMLSDFTDYEIEWDHIKTNKYLKTQVEIILAYRILIRNTLNKKIKNAKSILAYFELNPE